MLPSSLSSQPSMWLCAVLLSLLCVALRPAGADLTFEKDCIAQIDGKRYDLSPFRGQEAKYTATYSDANQTVHQLQFYLNFCGITTVDPLCADKDAMLCVVERTIPAANATANATATATAFFMPYPHTIYSWAALVYPSPGFVLSGMSTRNNPYSTSEDACPNGGGPINSRILVMCDPNDGKKPYVTSYLPDSYRNDCSPNMYVYHSVGCLIESALNGPSISSGDSDSASDPTAARAAIGLGVALAVVLCALLIAALMKSAKRCCWRRGGSAALLAQKGSGDMYAVPPSAPALLHDHGETSVSV